MDTKTVFQENPISHSFSKMFSFYKDLLCKQNSFNLNIFRKNLVTKVFCSKLNAEDSCTFLFSVSYFNDQKLLGIVAAGLEYLGKKVHTEKELDIYFVNTLKQYLSTNGSFIVNLNQNSISLYSNKSKLELIDIESDEASKQLLVRSLCVFFAICGKTVSNNLDITKLNDYGCILD